MLKSVTDVLQKHPELAAPLPRVRDQPDQEKLRHAREHGSFHQDPGRVRGEDPLHAVSDQGQLRRLEEDPRLPGARDAEGLNKEKQKEFRNNAQARFDKYLERVLRRVHRKLFEALDDPNADYLSKSKRIHDVLLQLSFNMKAAAKPRSADALHRIMADLVNTVGFEVPATQALLKSKNAADRLEGIKKAHSERESFAGQLDDLSRSFKDYLHWLYMGEPVGYIVDEDYPSLIARFEKEILASKAAFERW